MTSEADPGDAVREALAAFDRGFATGDAEAVAAACAIDARFLLLFSAPKEGREAIRDAWALFFVDYDTSAWVTDRLIVDVHGDHAYTVSTYTETLVPRGEGPSLSISGRLVLFLRREPGGPWLITLALNSHARPAEELHVG